MVKGVGSNVKLEEGELRMKGTFSNEKGQFPIVYLEKGGTVRKI